MPRLARAIAVGCAHHITQHGNNRQDVFFVDEDRQVYVELLKEQAQKYGLEILAYCLMTNHVHLVAIPRAEEALAQAIGRTHFRYTQYINRCHRHSGHLWQGRFYSCALDGRYLWPAIKYVELNPVRAKLCRRAWQCAWSSAALHVDEKAQSELLNLPRWYKQISGAAWRKELAEGLTDEEVAQIRLRTHTGRPLGSDRFLAKLEAVLGRRARPLPVGRPKKQTGYKDGKRTADR
jgi:putative transposase